MQQCHQAFLRLPFEANPERVADEIAKLLHSMKVGGRNDLGGMAVIRGAVLRDWPVGRTVESRRIGFGTLDSCRRAWAQLLPPAVCGPVAASALKSAAVNSLVFHFLNNGIVRVCTTHDVEPWMPDWSAQEAMFGEEEAGAPNSNKDSALIIAYEAVSTGLFTDMVTYLGMLEFESRKDLVGAAASGGASSCLPATTLPQPCSLCCGLAVLLARQARRAHHAGGVASAPPLPYGVQHTSRRRCWTRTRTRTPPARQVTIFGALVRIEHNGDFPGLRYLLENDGILVTLFDG